MTTSTKMKRTKPATKAQVAQRVADVIRWQTRGAGLQEILSMARDPKLDRDGCPVLDEEGSPVPAWGARLHDDTIRRYIAKANTFWDEYLARMGHEAIGKAFARLDMLFARCLRINDFKAALAVQKEINNLAGLKRVLVELRGAVQALTDEELEKEIARLEEAQRGGR